MALMNLSDWNEKKAQADKGSAASFTQSGKLGKQATLATGTACGAGKPAEKPASACGAGEPEKKPAACGSACGASKPAEPEKKPVACGSACGAGK